MTACVILPTINTAGPMTAATVPTVTKNDFVPTDRLVNHSTMRNAPASNLLTAGISCRPSSTRISSNRAATVRVTFATESEVLEKSPMASRDCSITNCTVACAFASSSARPSNFAWPCSSSRVCTSASLTLVPNAINPSRSPSMAFVSISDARAAPP